MSLYFKKTPEAISKHNKIHLYLSINKWIFYKTPDISIYVFVQDVLIRNKNINFDK